MLLAMMSQLSGPWYDPPDARVFHNAEEHKIDLPSKSVRARRSAEQMQTPGRARQRREATWAGSQGASRERRGPPRRQPRVIAAVAPAPPRALARQEILVASHDFLMLRGGHILADQQLLVQFLAIAQPDNCDFDVSVGFGVVADIEAGDLDHRARQINDFDRLPHVEDKYVAAARHRRRLNHELRGFGDQHKVSCNLGVRDRYRSAPVNLLPKQGDVPLDVEKRKPASLA